MKRAEVWRVNLDPTLGAEIRKTRPVVIVNDDAIGVLPLRVVVPITDWKDRYSIAPWMVKLEINKQNGLTKTSAADAFQVRSLSQVRFVDKIGILDDDTMKILSSALAAVLKITS